MRPSASPPPPPEDSLPPLLRELLDAELAAGNSVTTVGHTHPAPPVGAYFMLARPVSTRPRESGGGLRFYERNSSSYSGEFTDAQRFFFILEPPLPPPPEPDMDAIREAVNRLSGEIPFRPVRDRISTTTSKAGGTAVDSPASPSPTERFRRSMQLDYGAWKEGTPYDLAALHHASPEELLEIEQLVLNHSPMGWRDVQALVALDSPRTRPVLLGLVESPSPEIRAALLRHAPEHFDAATRTRILIRNIQSAEPFAGLTETIDQVASFHPPEIVGALLQACLDRSGEIACLLGALLLHIHGHASTPLALELRPCWLQLNTDDRARREEILAEICARIGQRMPKTAPEVPLPVKAARPAAPSKPNRPQASRSRRS